MNFFYQSTLKNRGGKYKFLNSILSVTLLYTVLCFLTTSACNKASYVNPIVFYTVTFNSMNGSLPDSIRIKSGEKVPKPTDPTRTNYTFEGWYSDQALTQAFDFNTPITNNIILYAKWKVNSGITSYVVIFKTNGSTNTIADQIVVVGDKAIKPTNPTRVNYTFEGWYSDQALTKLFDFNTAIITNTILYAKWQINPEKTSYTVIFKTNGSTNIIADQIVVVGDKAIRPTDPIRTDYIFGGWYLDGTFTKLFDFNTVITTNITLYAKWISTTIISQLYNILIKGVIPNNLSGYDIVSQQVLSSYPPGAKVVGIYITVAGAGKKDGTSWENSYSQTQIKTAIDGIIDASSSKIYLVLMGAGTYIFGSSLNMKNDVAIVGGWPPTGGWIRRPKEDITVISGNNQYRIFYNDHIDTTALLYSATLQNGLLKDPANPGDNNGSAMYNIYSSPKLINVTFSNNTVVGNGGAMYNMFSSPTLTNVVFSGNQAITSYQQYGVGGAMYNNTSSPTLTNVIFDNNQASTYGGGIYNFASSFPILTNVLLYRNFADAASGGGMCNNASSPILTNVIFLNNNSKYGRGGGLYNQGSSPALTNTVFLGNTAPNGYGGGMENDASSPILVNSIFWNNTAYNGDPQYTSGANVTYSVVQNISGKTINSNDPNLNVLEYTLDYFMPTIRYFGTSPDHLGVYVKRTKSAPYMLYYSIDGITWYTDPSVIGTGTPAILPFDLIDITSMDIQGHPRIGRPNAGVWAK